MNILKNIVLMLVLFLISASGVYAQQQPDNPSLQTNCNESNFCDEKDGTTFIRKTGCRYSTQAREKYKNDGESLDDASAKGASVCICNFERIPNGCGNLGGVKDTDGGGIQSVFGRVTPPDEIRRLGEGQGGISNILQVIIRLIYIVAAIAFVLLFLWSAVQLIWSGGDKEKVGQARQRITWAVIGLALLSLAFVIFRILEGILGFKLIG